MHVVGNDGSEGNDENINAITNFDKDLCLPSISIEHWWSYLATNISTYVWKMNKINIFSVSNVG